MSENTRDAVRAIAAASGTVQTRMIDDFLRTRWVLFGQIARWLCRNFGVSPEQHWEDFRSMVAMEANAMLTEQISDEEKLERIEVWEGMLRVRSRQIVRNFLDKEMAPAAEMTTVLRRVRMLNSLRDEMRQERGAEPTDQEIVETHNARMYAARSNPVKQGVLATLEDLRTFRATADVDDHDYTEPIDTDFVLHPVEGPRFIELLVRRTGEHNAKLGEAAHLWLSGLYRTDGPPVIASVEEIAEQMVISRSTARTYIRKIKEYAVEVAQAEFNITEDDV